VDVAASRKEAKFLGSQLHTHSPSLPLKGSLLNSAVSPTHPHHLASPVFTRPMHCLAGAELEHTVLHSPSVWYPAAARPTGRSFPTASTPALSCTCLPIITHTPTECASRRSGGESHHHHQGLTPVVLQCRFDLQPLENPHG